MARILYDETFDKYEIYSEQNLAQCPLGQAAIADIGIRCQNCFFIENYLTNMKIYIRLALISFIVFFTF
jgi:hypothetical protein